MYCEQEADVAKAARTARGGGAARDASTAPSEGGPAGGAAGRRGKGGAAERGVAVNPMACSVYVIGLPKDATHGEIESHFNVISPVSFFSVL